MCHDSWIDTIPHRQDTGRETNIKYWLQHSPSPLGASICQTKRRSRRNFMDSVWCPGGLPARTAPSWGTGPRGAVSAQAHRTCTMLILGLGLTTEPGTPDGFTIVVALWQFIIIKQEWDFLNEKAPFNVWTSEGMLLWASVGHVFALDSREPVKGEAWDHIWKSANGSA